MSVNAAVTATPGRVDVRATRFVATVTATVLAVVLILAGFSVRAAAVLLSVQALVFAVGAVWGPARHPYGVMFRRLIAPRRGPATKLEAVEQIRFAQLMGFTFCAVGIAGFVLGAPLVGLIATGFALFAALMRAVFGICLSRGPYMLVCRLRGKVPPCCQDK
ncbi:MAG TPA: DUF4395 domain-containing protein [Mycobacterium sp.]|nr:DUF4395 domain-containing protein [Mycobacterium sp.]